MNEDKSVHSKKINLDLETKNLNEISPVKPNIKKQVRLANDASTLREKYSPLKANIQQQHHLVVQGINTPKSQQKHIQNSQPTDNVLQQNSQPLDYIDTDLEMFTEKIRIIDVQSKFEYTMKVKEKQTVLFPVEKMKKTKNKILAKKRRGCCGFLKYVLLCRCCCQKRLNPKQFFDNLIFQKKGETINTIVIIENLFAEYDAEQVNLLKEKKIKHLFNNTAQHFPEEQDYYLAQITNYWLSMIEIEEENLTNILYAQSSKDIYFSHMLILNLWASYCNNSYEVKNSSIIQVTNYTTLLHTLGIFNNSMKNFSYDKYFNEIRMLRINNIDHKIEQLFKAYKPIFSDNYISQNLLANPIFNNVIDQTKFENELYLSSQQFFADLIEISNSVMKNWDKSYKQSYIQSQLRKVNSNLPSFVNLPSQDREKRRLMIMKIDPSEVRIFETKSKVNYMITLELVAPEEYLMRNTYQFSNIREKTIKRNIDHIFKKSFKNFCYNDIVDKDEDMPQGEPTNYLKETASEINNISPTPNQKNSSLFRNPNNQSCNFGFGKDAQQYKRYQTMDDKSNLQNNLVGKYIKKTKNNYDPLYESLLDENSNMKNQNEFQQENLNSFSHFYDQNEGCDNGGLNLIQEKKSEAIFLDNSNKLYNDDYNTGNPQRHRAHSIGPKTIQEENYQCYENTENNQKHSDFTITDQKTLTVIGGTRPKSNTLEIKKTIVSAQAFGPERKSSDLIHFESEKQRLRIRAKSMYSIYYSWNIQNYIVKVGEDVRQEQFAMQLIKEFDFIFKKAKQPLKLTPYEIIPIGPEACLIEMIQDAITIDSLKKLLTEKYNRSISLMEFFDLNFNQTLKIARENFQNSQAAYCQLCYFQQIKDRHNGNIMLHRNGSMIHIDFGFLFTTAPGKGIKLEEVVPFKLLGEYIAVLGDQVSNFVKIFRR